jgi:hypothetical protein
VDEANEAYGKTVGEALKVVRQLHWDTMRLFTDFDGLMAGWKCVFGNIVTSAISSSLSAGFWMAEGVFRYYVSPSEQGAVHGLTVAFEDSLKRRVDKPLLLAAQIAYQIGPSQEITTVCQHWDIWELFFEKSAKRELGHVIAFHDPYPGRIARAHLIAVPLYSLDSVEDVLRLLNTARDAASQGTMKART